MWPSDDVAGPRVTPRRDRSRPRLAGVGGRRVEYGSCGVPRGHHEAARRDRTKLQPKPGRWALEESPTEIRLWFSQSPQIDGTSVRVLPVGGEPVEMGDARLDEQDEHLVLASLTAPLAGGSYEVRWRAMARDGHVVRGTFEFQVATAR